MNKINPLEEEFLSSYPQSADPLIEEDEQHRRDNPNNLAFLQKEDEITGDPQVSSGARTILAILVFINIIRSVGGTSISIGLPDLITSLEGSASAFGLVVGMFSIAAMIFQVPMAMLSDKIGRKKAILLSMGIYLLGTTLCAFSQSVLQLILFRGIQGAGAYGAILLAIISDAFEPKERSRAISYFTISLTGGYLIGNLIGGLAATSLGSRGVFLLNSAMVGTCILIVIFILPETNPLIQDPKPKHQNIHGTKEISVLPKNSDFPEITKSNHTHRRKTEQYRCLKNPHYLYGLFMLTILSFVLYGTLNYQIWLYQKGFNLSKITVSLLVIPTSLLYILGSYIAPNLVHKFGRIRVLRVCFFIFMLFSISLLVFYKLIWFIILAGLNSFILGMAQPEITTFTQNYIPKEERGFGSGVLNTMVFLFRAIGEIVVPAISDVGGYYAVYSLIVALTVIMYLSLILYQHHDQKYQSALN